MWDALFAIDSTLEIVDMISLAMLLRIRWDLVAADTNEAFTLLLRYPEPAVPAYTFIKDALYLRDHLDPQGGAEIISRYGKQAPTFELDSSPVMRESSPSPSLNSSRTRRSLGSPRSFVGQQGAGIEALLQGAAKNVIERGSQWNVGKAIREAVGEVKKNVEAYQTGTLSGQTTPRAGGREFRKPAQLSTATANARPDLARTQSGNVKKVEDLERRNRNLAKMLEAAVGELWEHHRERNEEQAAKADYSKGKEALEALSLAIAKVQFVQVYLEDSSIPLPDEATELAASAKVVETLTLPEAQSPPPSAPIPSAPPISVDPPPALSSPGITSPQKPPAPSSPPPRSLQASSHLSPRSRPHLTASNFSWMLGEDSASSNFATGAAHSTFSSDEKRRMKGKGFLFGDDDEEDGSGKEGKGKGKGGSISAKGGKGAKTKHVPEMEVEEEIINLDNMGGRGVM